jgi:hypothetical protein
MVRRMQWRWFDRRRSRGVERERAMLLELLSPYMSVAVVAVFWALAVRRPAAVPRGPPRPPRP